MRFGAFVGGDSEKKGACVLLFPSMRLLAVATAEKTGKQRGLTRAGVLVVRRCCSDG